VHFSGFGQVLILLMIQIGGIGFMTFVAVFLLLLKRKIDFGKRQLLIESMGLLKLSGITRLVKRIIVVTLICELSGTILLSFSFIPQFGFGQGLYYSLFHSVSAFCNAGIDLFYGNRFGSNNSLEIFSHQPYVLMVFAALIFVGGIGFLVWDDVITNGLHFKKYRLHSKLVLTTTAILILGGWILFFAFEYNQSLREFDLVDKIFISLFHSISPRTAGFGVVRLSHMSSGGQFLTMVLEFIGGSSGSTAGGIKTTTLAVLFLNFLRTPRATKGIYVFNKKIDDNTIKQASALVAVYFILIVGGILSIAMVEDLPLINIVFEVVSSISTTGMSFDGTTLLLSGFSRAIIILLMFVGRIGCIAFIFGMIGKKINPKIDRMPEKIQIG